VLAVSRRGPGWGNVLGIGVAEAAVSTQGRQTLLEGCESAILAAEARIVRAPRIILSLRACAGSSYRHHHYCQHEKQQSHGRSPDVTLVPDVTSVPKHQRCRSINGAEASTVPKHQRCQSINTEGAKLFQQRGQKLVDWRMAENSASSIFAICHDYAS
jgi:2-oxoglutarate dehydrogenase complex dehydrogenase (E1) component-like enzyme